MFIIIIYYDRWFLRNHFQQIGCGLLLMLSPTYSKFRGLHSCSTGYPPWMTWYICGSPIYTYIHVLCIAHYYMRWIPGKEWTCIHIGIYAFMLLLDARMHAHLFSMVVTMYTVNDQDVITLRNDVARLEQERRYPLKTTECSIS